MFQKQELEMANLFIIFTVCVAALVTADEEEHEYGKYGEWRKTICGKLTNKKEFYLSKFYCLYLHNYKVNSLLKNNHNFKLLSSICTENMLNQ